MTIKTHAFLATTATLVLIALIYYRSNSGDDSRLKKVMEKTKDLPAEAASKPTAKPEAKKGAPKAEAPKAEEPVIQEKTEKAAEPVKKVPAKKVEKPNDDFLVSQDIVRNGSFKDGFKGWRYWGGLSEEKGKELVKTEEEGLSLRGQLNKMMGIAQTIEITSGTVYQISAKVRSADPKTEKKTFMGARLALNAPGQKELQLIWLYKNWEWEEKSLVFTNRVTGMATLFFHTGYTTNAATCLVKDISLIPANDYPKANICSSNGDFKNDLKGWNFWQITASEGSNIIKRVSEGEEAHVLLEGRSGGRLMGLSQAVSVVSGAVYRMSANVKSQDVKEKGFFGARVALYAPNQKEQQIVWTYNTKDWEAKNLVFTNNYSGAATFYFHTGYTTNACEAMFKDLSLIKKR